MQPVSAAFLAAVTNNPVVARSATVNQFDGKQLVELQITDGTVWDDITNATRRRCTVTLTDPTGTLTPANAADVLAPYGNELRLGRGFAYTDGTSEIAPLGVFGVSSVTVDDKPDGLLISVEGFDRSRRVQRAKFADAYPLAAGANAGTAIQTMLSARVAGLAFNFAPVTYTIPLTTYQPGDDPWQGAQDIAKASGCDLYFDRAGVCVLTPITDPALAPVAATFTEGNGMAITALSRKLTDEQTYSHVVATGESTGISTPVRGEALDTNPTSPTYYLGPYGDVVRFYSSPLLTTDAQCAAAAASILARGTGLSEQVTFDSLVNPALDAGDVMAINRARSKVAARYSADALVIPLGASAGMNATTRRRTV